MCMLSRVPTSKSHEQIFYESDDNFDNNSNSPTCATNYYHTLYNNGIGMYIILFTHIFKKIFSNTKPYKTLINSNGLNSTREFLEISITLYVLVLLG